MASPSQGAFPNPAVEESPSIRKPEVKPVATAIIKNEEQDDGTVDPTLAIFEDVDNEDEEEEEDDEELVDENHVGFIDYNGVNCWVCPGSSIQLFTFWSKPSLT